MKQSIRNKTLLIFLALYILYSFPGVAQFTLLKPKDTGIRFANTLTEDESANVLAYEYFYNGGGVAVGDFNNDGLLDIYFTGNMVPDRLYLNKGNLKFKDITNKAGINKGKGWKTGVTLVDINQDGYLDIYVCYSGNGDVPSRRNRLYINNKDLTFTESGYEYGLNISSHSTQAVFLDYDKDSDLDCFILNHNIKEFKRFDAAAIKSMRDENAGDLLLRNENGRFVDVCAEAGIKGNPIGFGLGVSVADINQDGWQDILVSNDYIEQDYLYINNGDGTFTDKVEDALGHLSYFSMGNEMADINNDGWPDILTLDMLPEDNRRQKLLYGPENYDSYQSQLNNNFYHQLMRNMLQLNNGDGTFSEVGQLMGISNTDWSWAPLVADFDNDGWKDLFITNGYLRDYTNMDFMKFFADEKLKASEGSETALMDILKEMPSTAIANYMFRNTGNLGFEDKGKPWGFDQSVLSNGAVYADMDNDGDLEIIVNNINQKAGIYRNDGGSAKNYLQVQIGSKFPAEAIGAQVWIYHQGTKQYQEFNPTRGFQSSMYMPLHFGLGEAEKLDSLKIVWANNKVQLVKDIPVNQKLVLESQDALKNYNWRESSPEDPIFTENSESPIPYTHQEDDYNDFKRQSMMPNMLSYQGPRLAQGDVNGNGLIDIYAAGAKDQQGMLLLAQEDGTYLAAPQPDFVKDGPFEDTGALFFDADGDGDPDLYVVSGGFAFSKEDDLLQDRLYINDGKGNFSRASHKLPVETISDAVVVAFDIDKDGDLDLFVGGRVIPGHYPTPASSRILINDGHGAFKDGTTEFAPFLKEFGMVTDAAALDVDNDGWNDLVVVGEWMPISFLKNRGGILQNETFPSNEGIYNGWWTRIAVEDVDNDGDPDIVVGNFGWNSQMKPSEKEPVRMLYDDFDENEAIDPFLTYYIQGKSYPMATRDEALNQMYGLRKKFSNYKSYANATMQDILTTEQLEGAKTLTAESFTSILLENNGNGSFTKHNLPVEAQFAPIYGIAFLDVNGDGLKDLVLGGNQTYTRLKIGKMDANYGMLFKNEGNCQFEYVPQFQSGLSVKGDVRDILVVPGINGGTLMFGRNNNTIIRYFYKTKEGLVEKF